MRSSHVRTKRGGVTHLADINVERGLGLSNASTTTRLTVLTPASSPPCRPTCTRKMKINAKGGRSSACEGVESVARSPGGHLRAVFSSLLSPQEKTRAGLKGAPACSPLSLRVWLRPARSRLRVVPGGVIGSISCTRRLSKRGGWVQFFSLSGRVVYSPFSSPQLSFLIPPFLRPRIHLPPSTAPFFYSLSPPHLAPLAAPG